MSAEGRQVILTRSAVVSVVSRHLLERNRDSGRREAALGYAQRLALVAPDDPAARQLVEQLAAPPPREPSER